MSQNLPGEPKCEVIYLSDSHFQVALSVSLAACLLSLIIAIANELKMP